MDQLFNQIIRDTYIRNEIFYFIRYDVNYKTTNTLDYMDVDVMIQNNHLYLLKSKLKRNEYLYSKNNAWITDSKIILNDLDLFIQCYNRFRHTISSRNIVELCATKHNWRAFKYIIQDHYGGDLYDLLISVNKDNFINCLEFGIKDGDLEMVLFVFSVDNKIFQREKTNILEFILTKAAMSGNVELFKIVRKHFEESFSLFSLRKVFIYHKRLLGTLVHCSISSVDIYNYIQKEYGIQFNEEENSLLFNPLIPLFSRLNISDTELNMIKTMLSNGSFSPEYVVESALLGGHYEVYTFVKDYYQFTYKPTINTHLNHIKYAFDSLDNIKFLVETVGIGYVFQDYRMATKSTEIFKYLYERSILSSSNHLPQQFNDIEKLELNLALCNNRNLDLLVYFKQNNLFSLDGMLSFLHRHPNLCTVDLARLIMQEEGLETLIAKRGVGKLILSVSATRISNVEIFKIIHNKYTSGLSDEHIRVLFSNAISGCRLATLKYLVNRHRKTVSTLTPKQLIDLLSQASQAGSIQILEYLLHETQDQLMSLNNDEIIKTIKQLDVSLILGNAIAYNHYDCVKFILSSFPKHLVIFDNRFNQYLARNCNLLMVKLLFNHHPPFHSLNYSLTLEVAHNYSKEIFDYLSEQCVREIERGVQHMLQ